MNIRFLPVFRNPYQKLLANALKKKRVNVIAPPKNPAPFFPITGAVLTSGKIDLLHLHWVGPYIGQKTMIKTLIKIPVFILDIFIIRHLLKTKIVWTIHNLFAHEAVIHKLELWCRRYLAKNVDSLICHSPTAKEVVCQTYCVPPAKVQVIPHGNYITWYENTIQQKESREKLNLPQDGLVFLNIGGIRPYKGIGELITSFQNFDKSQNVKLLIAGKPVNQKIADEIYQKIDHHPNIKTVFEYIPDQDIQIYLNAADVVVLPYKNILTSGSLLLAFSFGKAVIAPKMGSIPDTLDEKGGILYDPDDENGLFNALQTALTVDLETMGKHNYKIAQKLDWDAIGEATYQIYQSIIDKK